MPLKIFNAVNAGAELRLSTPRTTAASVSIFLTRVAFRCRTYCIYDIKTQMKLKACVSDPRHIQQQKLLKQ